MNADPENFDDLRRLLALKRHEHPHPRYFNDFSSSVIARIKAGERGDPASMVDRLFGQAGWWQRALAVIEAKPSFAGAFGAAVCALLISGIVYSENAPAVAAGSFFVAETGSSIASTAAAASDPLDQSLIATGSTSPVAPAPASPWDQFQFPKAQPASFSVPGN